MTCRLITLLTTTAFVALSCGDAATHKDAGKDSTGVVATAGKEVPVTEALEERDLSEYGAPLLITLPKDAAVFKTETKQSGVKLPAIGIAAGTNFKLEIIRYPESAETVITGRRGFYLDPAKDHAFTVEEESPTYLQLRTPKEGTLYFFRALPAGKDGRGAYLIQKGGDYLSEQFQDHSFVFNAADVTRMLTAAKSARLK